jgi:uncharacterized membrane protein YkoI
MKIQTLSSVVLAATLFLGCASEQEAKLESQARISKPEAEKIALAHAPNGTIKEGELENEKGRLIWSFDIATAGSQDITEIQVDAKTGQVVSVEKETPKQERKEK